MNPSPIQVGLRLPRVPSPLPPHPKDRTPHSCFHTTQQYTFLLAYVQRMVAEVSCSNELANVVFVDENVQWQVVMILSLKPPLFGSTRNHPAYVNTMSAEMVRRHEHNIHSNFGFELCLDK
jgi:hypothetical protein